MFYVMDQFGVTKAVATKIVDIIDKVGWTGVAASIIMTLASGGTLGTLSVTIDAVIITVKQMLANSLKAAAILY